MQTKCGHHATSECHEQTADRKKKVVGSEGQTCGTYHIDHGKQIQPLSD